MWFLFSKIYQGEELLGCRNWDTTSAQFIACRPDLFFQLLPWQLALSELPVTAQAFPPICAACLLPSAQDGAGDRETFAQGTPAHSCEVRGVNTPRGRAFGSGMKEPVHEPHPPSGLTACSTICLASWRGISLGPEAYSIPCWLPLSHLTLVTSRDTGPLQGGAWAQLHTPCSCSEVFLPECGGRGVAGLWRRD